MPVPFEMQMVKRHYASGDRYRFGFNGKENERENVVKITERIKRSITIFQEPVRKSSRDVKVSNLPSEFEPVKQEPSFQKVESYSPF
jgi:hypothetical protein